MTKSRLEKVLEYMVNGEKELASEMLHEHLIETAREIYADLAEEDELAEDELELDEDEELDEDMSMDDESGDFIDDLEGIEDELETEEYFGEAEDDDEDEEAMDDLEGGLDMGAGDELAGDDFEADEGDIDDAMVNVEDAMAELRAAFADIMGSEDEEMGDDVADEFDDGMDGEEMDDEGFEDEDLGESATLTKVAAPSNSSEAVHTGKFPKGERTGAKPVNFAGGSDEAGGKAGSPKKMSVTGPQEQKGKMDKKVAAPKTGADGAKSNIS